MKNAILYLFLFALLAVAKSTNASVPYQGKLGFAKAERDTIYVLSEEDEQLKRELMRDLKTLRTLSNLAILSIPVSIITFGLGLLAGFVLSVIALVKMIKIKQRIADNSVLATDEELESRLFNAFIRTGFVSVIYAILFLLFLTLLAEVFFFTESFLSIVLVLGALAFGLFALFDGMIFRTKKI